MYKDINGKTGYKNLKCTSGRRTGNMKKHTPAERADFLADGITEVVPVGKTSPTEVELVEKAQENKIRYLGECAKYAGELPFKATVGGVEYEYDAEGGSRELMLGAVTRVNSGWVPPVDWYWKTLDNQRPVTNAADLIGISDAMATVVETAWVTNDYLKDVVRAATTVEAIDGVRDAVTGDVTGGIWWPWYNGVDPRELI